MDEVVLVDEIFNLVEHISGDEDMGRLLLDVRFQIQLPTIVVVQLVILQDNPLRGVTTIGQNGMHTIGDIHVKKIDEVVQIDDWAIVKPGKI